MKTTLRNIAMTIGLTAVLGGSTLIAESWNRSIANIPFEFQVKKTTLPAGAYTVNYYSDSKMIALRNIENGRSSMVLVHQFKAGTTADPKISFRYDGEHYKMDEVSFAGAGSYGLLKGKHDTERGVAATVRLVTK